MNDIRQIVNHYLEKCPSCCKIPDKFWECSFRHPELAKVSTSYSSEHIRLYTNQCTDIRINVHPTTEYYGRITCTHMNTNTFEISNFSIQCHRQLDNIISNQQEIQIIREYVGLCKHCEVGKTKYTK